MVRWLRWHCPPDTGFEIRALAVWGRACYLSVTEAPTILTFTRGWGRNFFFSFKPPRPGTEPRTLAWKAAVLTTTLRPPPYGAEEGLVEKRWWKAKSVIFTLFLLGTSPVCLLMDLSSTRSYDALMSWDINLKYMEQQTIQQQKIQPLTLKVL